MPVAVGVPKQKITQHINWNQSMCCKHTLNQRGRENLIGVHLACLVVSKRAKWQVYLCICVNCVSITKAGRVSLRAKISDKNIKVLNLYMEDGIHKQKSLLW